jgi:hypothetical protein
MPKYVPISNDTSCLDQLLEEVNETPKLIPPEGEQDGEDGEANSHNDETTIGSDATMQAEQAPASSETSKPKSKVVIENFGGGLYAKRKRHNWCWYFKTTVDRREKWIELGYYPQMSIFEARKDIQKFEKGITTTKKTVKARALRSDVKRASLEKKPRNKILKLLPSDSTIEKLIRTLHVPNRVIADPFNDAFSLLTMLPWMTFDDIANITTGSLVYDAGILNQKKFIAILDNKKKNTWPKVANPTNPFDCRATSSPVVKIFICNMPAAKILQKNWQRIYEAQYRQNGGPSQRSTFSPPTAGIQTPDGTIPAYEHQQFVSFSGNEYLFPELNEMPAKDRFSTVRNQVLAKFDGDAKEELHEDSLQKTFIRLAECLPIKPLFIDQMIKGLPYIKEFPKDAEPLELELLNILSLWWDRFYWSNIPNQ